MGGRMGMTEGRLSSQFAASKKNGIKNPKDTSGHIAW
jgi:hypothetical protein